MCSEGLQEMTAPWRIEYISIHKGDYFDEWWEIIDEQRTFVAHTQADADWLLTILSERDKTP